MSVLNNLKIFIKESFPRLSDLLSEIKKPYNTFVKKKYAKKRNSEFKKESSTVFSLFCEALKEADVKFWLTFGTLLGAVREKGFIAHDLDIDVAVFSNDNLIKAHERLLVKGFILSREIVIYTNNASTIGFERTYKKDSISIDIFVFYRENEKFVYTHDFMNSICKGSLMIYTTVRQIRLPLDKFIDWNFLGNKVLIPSNYNEYLRAHYGDDFMIPNPKWSTLSSPAAKVIHGAYGVIDLSK